MQFEVISNQSPYKRIEIGAREWPKVEEPDLVACYAMPAPAVWGAVVEAMEAEYGGVFAKSIYTAYGNFPAPEHEWSVDPIVK